MWLFHLHLYNLHNLNELDDYYHLLYKIQIYLIDSESVVIDIVNDSFSPWVISFGVIELNIIEKWLKWRFIIKIKNVKK